MAVRGSPTRMELLKTKQKIKLAQKGHKLLKKKRDALVMKFFEATKKARGVRKRLADTMNDGYKSLIRAEAISGMDEVESIVSITPRMGDLKMDLVNVMGVRIPQIAYEKEKTERNYSPLFSSSSLDITKDKFNKAKNEIIELIETEETLKRLSKEIVKTKRRVNALEYVMIPNLIHTQKYIRSKLEEIERENFFRLKVVKKKKTKK